VMVKYYFRFKKLILIAGKLDVWRYIFCCILHSAIALMTPYRIKLRNAIFENV
jgi:hypothetical protein